MALELDFLQRIINVHWDVDKGAVFVAAGNYEMILRAEISKEDIRIRQGKPEAEKQPVFKVISIPDDFSGETAYVGIKAGSYRKVITEKDKEEHGIEAKPSPVFVLGGNDQAVAAVGSHTWGIIMRSHDGKEWTRSGKLETGDYGANDAGFRALVWDDTFYAHAFSDEFYFPPPVGETEVNTYDVMFSSKEGTNFTEVDRKLRYNSELLGGVTVPPPNYDRPAGFEAHFKNPAKLPDGTFGYDEKRDSGGLITESFLVVPKEPSHYWLGYTNLITGVSYDGKHASRSVEITILKDLITTKKTVETPIYVNGISYVNGILMVGGTDGFKAVIVCSIDQGDTWEEVWRADNDYMQEVWVIMGAPAEDIVQTTD